jgi:hypothetical protein
MLIDPLNRIDVHHLWLPIFSIVALLWLLLAHAHILSYYPNQTEHLAPVVTNHTNCSRARGRLLRGATRVP